MQITLFTMATDENKLQSSCFSPAELKILMTMYAESEHILFKTKKAKLRQQQI